MTNLIKDVISAPSKIIPSLSQNEIQTILIQAISAYKKNTITLERLTILAGNIKHFNNTSLPTQLENVIEEIHSFACINTVLTDMLDELKENEKTKEKNT